MYAGEVVSQNCVYQDTTKSLVFNTSIGLGNRLNFVSF